MTDRKLIICACLSYEFKLGTSASSASCKLQNDPCQDSRIKVGDYSPSTVFTRHLPNRFLLVFELS